jgi:hypothetical protein
MQAFAHHHPFIEEAHTVCACLEPLTLSHGKTRIPALASWFFLANRGSMFTRKAEQAFPAPTSHAFSPNHSLEPAFL